MDLRFEKPILIPDRGAGLATPDLEDVKESVRQGVSKVAGRLSNMASGVFTSLQVGAKVVHRLKVLRIISLSPRCYCPIKISHRLRDLNGAVSKDRSQKG